MKMETDREAGAAILTLGKTDFTTKAIVRDREGPVIPLPGIYPKKPKTLH